jgi:hypothetical protein
MALLYLVLVQRVDRAWDAAVRQAFLVKFTGDHADSVADIFWCS